MHLVTEQEEIIERIVNEYSTSIIRVVFTYVKNMEDAQDIAQEVFLAYMLNMPRFELPVQEKAWLMKTAINKSKNHLKSWWRKRTTVIPDDLSYMPEESSILLQTVMNLQEKYRLPIYLFYFEDYSMKEIAEQLKVSVSTVGTWLDRGRKNLKEKIGEDYIG